MSVKTYPPQNSLDLTKPIVCRDGVVPTIYCTDAPGRYPIHGRRPDNDAAMCWTENGEYNPRLPMPELDLVNVPEPLVVWLNISSFCDVPPKLNICAYHTKQDADFDALPGRIGRKRIVIDNPEGFDE